MRIKWSMYHIEGWYIRSYYRTIIHLQVTICYSPTSDFTGCYALRYSPERAAVIYEFFYFRRASKLYRPYLSQAWLITRNDRYALRRSYRVWLCDGCDMDAGFAAWSARTWAWRSAPIARTRRCRSWGTTTPGTPTDPWHQPGWLSALPGRSSSWPMLRAATGLHP